MPPNADDKRGALVALGITAGISLLGFALIAGTMQDPDTTIPEASQERAKARQAAFEADNGAVPAPRDAVPGAKPGCGADDLDVHLRVRQEGDFAQAKVQLTNRCPTAVTWTTPSLCLSSKVAVLATDGTEQPVPVMCAQMIKEWTLEPTKMAEQKIDLPPFGPGTHEVALTLDGTGLRARQTITVAE